MVSFNDAGNSYTGTNVSKKTIKHLHSTEYEITELNIAYKVVSFMCDALPTKSSKRKGMESVLSEIIKQQYKYAKAQASTRTEDVSRRADESNERYYRFVPNPDVNLVKSKTFSPKLQPLGFKRVVLDEFMLARYLDALDGSRRIEAFFETVAKLFDCESKEIFIYQWTPDGFKFWFPFNVEFHRLLKGTSRAWFEAGAGVWMMDDNADAIKLLLEQIKLYFALIVEADSVAILVNEVVPALSRVPTLVDPDDAVRIVVGRKRNKIPYTWVTVSPVPFSLERFMVMLRDVIIKESDGCDEALWVNASSVGIFNGKHFVAYPKGKVILAHFDKLVFELVSDYGAARIVRVDAAANPKSLVVVFESDGDDMTREIKPYLETYRVLDMPTYSEAPALSD